MNSIRLVCIAGMVAIIANIMLIVMIGLPFDAYRMALRAIVIAVLAPGLYSDAKLTDVIKDSVIVKVVFKLR